MSWYIQSTLLQRSQDLVAAAIALSEKSTPDPTEVNALEEEIDECRFLSINANPWRRNLLQTIQESNKKEDSKIIKANLNLAQRKLDKLHPSGSQTRALDKVTRIFCVHYLGEQRDVDISRTYSNLLNPSCASSSSSSSSSSMSTLRPPSPWPVTSPPPTPPFSPIPPLNISPWPNLPPPLPSPSTSLMTPFSSTTSEQPITKISSPCPWVSSSIPSSTPFIPRNSSPSTWFSPIITASSVASSPTLNQLLTEDLPFPSKNSLPSSSSRSNLSQQLIPTSPIHFSPFSISLTPPTTALQLNDSPSSTGSSPILNVDISESSEEIEDTSSSSSSTTTMSSLASEPASPVPLLQTYSTSSSSAPLFSNPVAAVMENISSALSDSGSSSPEPDSLPSPAFIQKPRIPRSASFPDILNPLRSHISTPDPLPFHAGSSPSSFQLDTPFPHMPTLLFLSEIQSGSSASNLQWRPDTVFPPLPLKSVDPVLEAELVISQSDFEDMSSIAKPSLRVSEVRSTFLEPTAITISKIAAFFDEREASDIVVDINDYLFSISTDVSNKVYESILKKSHKSDLNWAYQHIADDRTLLLNVLLEELPYIPVPLDRGDRLSFSQMRDALFAILAADKAPAVQAKEINTVLRKTSEKTRHAIYEEIFEKSSDRYKENSMEWIQAHIADNWTILWNAIIAKMPITVSPTTRDEEVFEESSSTLISFVLTWVAQILSNQKLDRQRASARIRDLLKGVSNRAYNSICMEILQKQQISKKDIDLRWVESHLASNQQMLINALINHVPCEHTESF